MKYLALGLLFLSATPVWAGMQVPSENVNMPALSAIKSFDQKAQRLVMAITDNKPEGAKDLFFPAEPFVMLKDMPGAAAYYQQLVGWYQEDITKQHLRLAENSALSWQKVKMGHCVWKKNGTEHNKIPYWSCYRNTIFVADKAGKTMEIAVKTIINWGDEWYITHLGGIPAAK